MKFYSVLFLLSTMASTSAFSVAKPVATMPRSINIYTGKNSPLSALVYGRDGEEEDGDSTGQSLSVGVFRSNTSVKSAPVIKLCDDDSLNKGINGIDLSDHHSHLVREVQVSDDCFSLRAMTSISRGTCIGVFDGTFRDKPDRMTLCVGHNKHVLNTGKFAKMNHSCDANVAFAWSKKGYEPRMADEKNIIVDSAPAMDSMFPFIVTTSDIAPGQDITFDYCSTEWEMASPFVCNCNTRNCYGVVKGCKFLTDTQLLLLTSTGSLAPHMKAYLSDAGWHRDHQLAYVRELTRSGYQLPLRVGVTYSSYDKVSDPLKEVDDYVCTPAYAFAKETCAAEVKRAYDFTPLPLHKATSFAATRDIVLSRSYDVFFNLCDGAQDYDAAGKEVLEALESSGGQRAAYTGSPSKYYEPTKLEMKRLAAYAGLNVPSYFHVTSLDRTSGNASNGFDAVMVQRRLESAGMHFPVIVKHVSGYSSVGITSKSRCMTIDDLCRQLNSFVDTYGEALVEHFIEGDEVTVLSCEWPLLQQQDDAAPVKDAAIESARRNREMGWGPLSGQETTEPISLTPIKVYFPEGETFKHYDLKWLTFNGMKWRPVACPSVDRLCREAATKAFVAILGGIGYGRSDFRVDADGRVWFLEINPNCGLFYPDEDGSADFVLQFDPLIDHALFAQGMMQAAILRQAVDVSVSQPCYRLGFNALQGHFLFTSRPIQSGELVFADEGAPFNLVSTEHVRKFWAASGDQRTLAQYGWPISDDVMIIWSQNHKEWRPINHSCDPNLWFGEGHSFNVYARRDIACEEHLTMDYSTFCCDPLFESFECGCGASCCRGHVEGSDYAQLNSLQACFGTRVTAYVYKTKTKRSDLR